MDRRLFRGRLRDQRLELGVVLERGEYGVDGDLIGVGDLARYRLAEVLERLRFVARFCGDHGLAVGAGGGAGDDVADMVEGELGVVGFAGGEVDGAQGEEHALVVAAEPACRFAAGDGALHVLQLEAGAGDVEQRRRVLVVELDQLLEVRAGDGRLAFA